MATKYHIQRSLLRLLKWILPPHSITLYWPRIICRLRTVAENPDKWHEQNAILGLHPTINKVNVYFAASAVISAMILNFAPPKIQRYFLNGASIVELGAVGNNVTLGIKLSY